MPVLFPCSGEVQVSNTGVPGKLKGSYNDIGSTSSSHSQQGSREGGWLSSCLGHHPAHTESHKKSWVGRDPQGSWSPAPGPAQNHPQESHRVPERVHTPHSCNAYAFCKGCQGKNSNSSKWFTERQGLGMEHRSSSSKPCHGQGHLGLEQVLKAWQNLAVNAASDGAATASLGSLCQRQQPLSPPRRSWISPLPYEPALGSGTSCRPRSGGFSSHGALRPNCGNPALR